MSATDLIRDIVREAADPHAVYDQLQAAYCRENGFPHFAPRYCYECRKDVYAHPRAQIDAAVTLITGCPHCHRSFCD